MKWEEEQYKKMLIFLQDTRGLSVPLNLKLFLDIPIEEGDLVFNDDLVLSNTWSNIVIPDNLTINGNLYLMYSKMLYLPDNLTIEGSLSMSFSKGIKYIPESLRIYGSIYASDSAVETVLVRNIGGYLVLSYCTLSDGGLPDNLWVGKDLTLDHVQNLKVLPKKLQVGGNLHVDNTELSLNYNKYEIKDMILEGGGYVDGDIYTE